MGNICEFITVDGLLVLEINILLHLVTRDAELEGVGVLHEGVEATPEDDARHPADDEDTAPGVLAGRTPEPLPEALQDYAASRFRGT